MRTNSTYGGWSRNPNHQLIGGKHPIIDRVSTIQCGAGFLPSTVFSVKGTSNNTVRNLFPHKKFPVSCPIIHRMHCYILLLFFVDKRQPNCEHALRQNWQPNWPWCLFFPVVTSTSENNNPFWIQIPKKSFHHWTETCKLRIKIYWKNWPDNHFISLRITGTKTSVRTTPKNRTIAAALYFDRGGIKSNLGPAHVRLGRQPNRHPATVGGHRQSAHGASCEESRKTKM